MRITLILLILNCFQSFSQIASPPNIELPEVLIEPMVDSSVVQFISCPAEFPGGMDSLKRYFNDFGKYIPENWSDSNFNKRGYVVFVVEIDGTLSNIEMSRSITEEADSLALELIRKMPKWIPACDQNGFIRERARLPIIFVRPE